MRLYAHIYILYINVYPITNNNSTNDYYWVNWFIQNILNNSAPSCLICNPLILHVFLLLSIKAPIGNEMHAAIQSCSCKLSFRSQNGKASEILKPTLRDCNNNKHINSRMKGEL